MCILDFNTKSYIDKYFLPWESGCTSFSNSFGLVTLLEILDHDAQLFCSLMGTLQNMEARLSLCSATDPLPKDSINNMQKCINSLVAKCASLQLNGALKIINYIRDNYSQYNCGRLSENITMFLSVVNKELGEHIFLIIPEERIRWFNNENSFGPEVSKAFKKANTDINEAGNCFALGLYTACIFHLMRVAEYGLRALARERNIKLKNKPLEWAEWGPLIRAIEKTVDPIELKAHAGLEKDAALDFYHGTLGDFRAFKDVYRNPVMHPRKTYNKYEAGSAMQHVLGFMRKLSTRITENTKKSINWKLKYSP